MPVDDQPLVLDVVDYEGTPVRCSAERWAEKIDANHPELTGRSFESEDLRAEGASEKLPQTSQLVTFLLGQALEKFASRRRSPFNRGRQAPVPAP